MTIQANPPLSESVNDASAPFVEIGNGNLYRVLQVRQSEGLWIVENVFQPGIEVPKHRHTGPVWAYTKSGAWMYKEYGIEYRADSFLYEPAFSTHTLHVIEPDTRVISHMIGVNLNLDEDDNVISVSDGPSGLAFYLAMCEQQGLPRPNVLTG